MRHKSLKKSGLHDNSLTNLQVIDTFSDLGHNATKLVTDNTLCLLTPGGMWGSKNKVRSFKVLVEIWYFL